MSSSGTSRLIATMTALLLLGTLWSFLSRVPQGAAQPADAPPSPRTGFAAPDFTADMLGGGSWTLSDFRGHPVILNLWASWCQPCRMELPEFERIHQQYQGRGLIVVGLNATAQDSEPAAAAFVRQLGLTFPIVLDRDGSISARYHLVGLPSTYFIGADGIIRTVIVGGPLGQATLQSNAESLLQGN